MLGAIMYVILWTLLQPLRRVLWRCSVEGLENLPPPGQGMVLAVNHLNWTDIHIFGTSLPLAYRPAWIAKIEMFVNAIVAWWLRRMLVIPIRRGEHDIAALAAAEDMLVRGTPVVIFPEGHRSRTGGLIEGRGGAVRLAARTGCPIVPVAIWGTETGLKGAFRRTPIHVRFGEPYYVPAQGGDVPWHRMDELTEEMMLRIAALLPEQYWGCYRESMLRIK